MACDGRRAKGSQDIFYKNMANVFGNLPQQGNTPMPDYILQLVLEPYETSRD